MLNHIRTLLMNIATPSPQTCAYAGDELIAPGYAPVVLSAALTNVRNLLFGIAPDRYMLNYRCNQLLQILHASPLAEFVTVFDPRITYDLQNEDFGNPSLYVPTVTPSSTTSGALYIVGEPVSPDSVGQLLYGYDVSIATTLRLQVDKPAQITLFDLIDDGDGFSQRIDLPGSGYAFRVKDYVDGDSWRIGSFLVQPQRGLGQIAAAMEHIGEASFTQLFGVEKVEPYLTFRNLWFDQQELPLRLSALVLALAFRTEERRSA